MQTFPLTSTGMTYLNVLFEMRQELTTNVRIKKKAPSNGGFES